MTMASCGATSSSNPSLRQRRTSRSAVEGVGSDGTLHGEATQSAVLGGDGRDTLADEDRDDPGLDTNAAKGAAGGGFRCVARGWVTACRCSCRLGRHEARERDTATTRSDAVEARQRNVSQTPNDVNPMPKHLSATEIDRRTRMA